MFLTKYCVINLIKIKIPTPNMKYKRFPSYCIVDLDNCNESSMCNICCDITIFVSHAKWNRPVVPSKCHMNCYCIVLDLSSYWLWYKQAKCIIYTQKYVLTLAFFN